MSWNYRIMRREENGQSMYGVVEAHYAKKGDTIPHSWTENFSAPYGETRDELVKDFAWFMAAMRHPVLNEQGQECEDLVIAADEIQKWIDSMVDVQGEA